MPKRRGEDSLSQPFMSRTNSRTETITTNGSGNKLGKTAKKVKIPRNHSTRPEALTCEDFQLIDFEGGRPYIFVDFIKHMTYRNYYEL